VLLARAGRRRALTLALLAGLVALILTPGVPGASSLQLAGLDAYQWLAPRTRASAPAVIVAIDDASLVRHGQWPWPRTILARLVRAIARARPAAIGFAIVMSEPDRLSPHRLPDLLPDLDPELAQRLIRMRGSDAALGDALREAPVVLGIAGLGNRAAPAPPLTARAAIHSRGGDPRLHAHGFPTALRSVEVIDRTASGRGLINVDPRTRIVRRVPLVAAVGGDLLPALGVEMLRVAAAEPVIEVVTGPAGISQVAVGDVRVPTEADGTAWIHYSPHDDRRFVSAADVLAGRTDPQRLERKLVLVGVTAVGLEDHHPTPVAARMTGVEIQAQLLENIFDRDHLTRPRWAPGAEAAALAAAGALLIGAVPALPIAASGLLGAGVLAAVLGGGVLAYLGAGILLDALVPALGLVLVFAAILAATLAEAQRQRRALDRQLREQRDAALRVAGELQAARRIQMGILPDPDVALAGEGRVALFAFLEPARTVGGDLYDVFRLDRDRLFFLIGDVAGKGVPGSLFMAVSKALCKSTALRHRDDLGATITEANADLARDNPEALFVTAWAGVLDAATGDLTYCNAGHEPALLLGADGGGHRPLGEGGGPPLCVMEDFPYETARHRLRAGQILCLVTDGVTEAMNEAGELYGRARLDAVLARFGAGATAAAVGDAVRADVTRFRGGAEPSDDLAILVVQWRGPEPRPAVSGP
jgi:serine phosphatase RsbU (regulator of sigma subunit)/CHASE2 domain-containing sensor protein